MSDSTATPRIEPPASKPGMGWPARITLALLLIGAIFAVLHLATGWAREGALREAAQLARNASQINAALLRNNLDKFRALPFVLTRDVDLRAALLDPVPAQIGPLDEKLEALSRGVGAAAIYVLDRTGYAIAASNWREPASFEGVDYQFRPYFRGAVAHGSAEHFALGTISHEAGLYLSRRVDAGRRHARRGGAEGGFPRAGGRLAPVNAPIFVTDEHGVVLLGSLPQWRFDVLAPLSEELAQRLRTSLQFGDARFQSVPISPPLQTSSTGTLVRADVALPQIPAGSPLLHTTLPITESPGWTLHLLSPVQSALNRASANAQLGALLAQSLLAAIVGVLLYRRHRGHEHTRQQTAIRQQLADQVHERTAQLRLANDRLLGEMDERQRAQARLHTLQDELVQASKLALLGQVAAGVAHEINQPVAAIRSYADNAAEFLRRQDPETARENLESIASLTERIGHITGELRAFSRKASTQVAPISLGAALDGAAAGRPARRAAGRGAASAGRRPGCAGAGRPHPAGAGAGQSAAERAGRSGRSARRPHHPGLARPGRAGAALFP